MKFETWNRVIAATLLATLAISVQLAAQDAAKQQHPHQYHHYQIADPGTFGGPSSQQTLGTFGAVGDLNNQGAFGGSADTTTIDPFCLNHPPDCYASDAFVFQNGAKTDLGILPDGLDSQVNWVSANGLIAGNAGSLHADPLLGNPFQIRGTFWGHDRVITDIGALPGTYLSLPIGVNNRGEVVGAAMNTIPDSNSMLGIGYQTRAFYWKDGVMQDLGALGTGTDAQAGMINERGQVVGVYYVNWTPTSCSADLFGIVFPFTTGSFIWDKKNGMRDIGGLGGSCTIASDLNNRGQVVGTSALTGDSVTHPFVWDAATGITDLMGASDGVGSAYAINDGGQIVGVVCDAVTCYAALWQKNGGKWQEKDLGIFAVGDCPNARSVNASAQVVGTDYCNGLPFLSEDGAGIVDLNTLVPSNSGLQLNEAGQINNRGEISINAADANGNNHSVVLIPCDENHPDVAGCDYSTIDAETAAAQVSLDPAKRPAALTPGNRLPGILNRFHFPGNRSVPGHAPAPGVSLALSATPATGDLLGDHQLVPQYGTPPSYCEISQGSNGVLTGGCIQSTGYTCNITSTGCNTGQPATLGADVVCANHEHWLSTTKCGSVPGFNVSSTGLTPTTVSAGGSATSTLTVSAYGGFGGSVAFSCSVQPASALAPTCLFSPRSVTSGTPSTLTVSTTAPTSALRTGTGSGLFYAFFLPFGGLFAMVLRFGPQPKRNGKFTAAVLACMLFAGVVFQAACGAKTPTPGTPDGRYIITVTGTDSSGTLAIPTDMDFYVQ